jgi:hypothetical protein
VFTLELTPKQIEAIFDAGRERGSDEATAYDWGQRASGERLDGLRDLLLYDRQNGVVTELEMEERDEWWAAFLTALQPAT